MNQSLLDMSRILFLLLFCFGVGDLHAHDKEDHGASNAREAPCPPGTQPHQVRAGYCSGAGYDFQVVTFNSVDQRSDLPLVLGLHWSSSMPSHLLKAMGRQSGSFRLLLPSGRFPKRGGYSYFVPEFYELSPEQQMQALEDEAGRLIVFFDDVRRKYKCGRQTIVTGVSQGGDLSFLMAVRHPQSIRRAYPIAGRNTVAGDSGWATAAPVTIYSGTDDPIVRGQQSVAEFNTALAVGARMELLEFANVGHDLSERMASQLSSDIARELPVTCKN